MAAKSEDPPWWLDSLIGVSFVLLGLVLFAVLYLRDSNGERPQPANPSYTFKVVDRWTFKDTAIGIGQGTNRPVRFEGFTPDELSSIVRSQQITADSVEKLIEALAHTAVSEYFPRYDVVSDGSFIVVKRK